MTQPQSGTMATPPSKLPSSPWKRWAAGLANAAISGATSAGAAQFVGVPLKQSAAIAGASALMSIMKWLAQHPLPGAE